MQQFPTEETISVAFKSEPAGGLSERAVLDAVLGLANAQGGTLYIGIEDSGQITGLRAEKSKWHDPFALSAFIADRTVPPLTVEAEIQDADGGKQVAVVRVPKAGSLTAASDGRVMRRRIKVDGRPENLPVYPIEFSSALSELRLLDFSRAHLPGAELADLDPMERLRLRKIIRVHEGESALLDLADEDFDKALGLVRSDENGRLRPTVCGLLMIGFSERLKALLPTAGAVFQVLHGSTVAVNKDIDLPIAACFEELLLRFQANNPEQEFLNGLYRTSIPDYDESAFREALVNAFCHRDYARFGRVRVCMTDEQLEISNPGGFIGGITVENILTAQPESRNPLLADAMKRIGLAERTRRGVDQIFESSVRTGREWPYYSESTTSHVVLAIPKGDPDQEFARLIARAEVRLGRTLPLASLMILSALRLEGGMTTRELLERLPKAFAPERIRSALRVLLRDGLIEPGTRTDAFVIKAQDASSPESPERAAESLELTDDEEKILAWVRKNGSASRGDIAELLSLPAQTAYRRLAKLCRLGLLTGTGERRHRRYALADKPQP